MAVATLIFSEGFGPKNHFCEIDILSRNWYFFRLSFEVVVASLKQPFFDRECTLAVLYLSRVFIMLSTYRPQRRRRG